MILFFLLAGNVLGTDSMVLSLSLLFRTSAPVVLFRFLVKKILDADLTMNSSPPVYLVSNSPYVFLTR